MKKFRIITREHICSLIATAPLQSVPMHVHLTINQVINHASLFGCSYTKIKSQKVKCIECIDRANNAEVCYKGQAQIGT
jgi:hypothetical protein